MKKTTSTPFNRKALAIAFLAGLTSFLLLLPAAGNKTTSSDPVCGSPAIQETQKYNKMYRTFVTDPVDGIEKKIELRYRDEVLTEVLIDGKLIKKEDIQKYEKIIREAETDIIDINRETSAVKEELKRAMEELRAIDFEAIKKEIEVSKDINIDIRTEEIEKEIEKVRKELEKIKADVIIKDIDDIHIFTEEDSAEIIKMMEEVRKDIQIDMDKIREEMANGIQWTIILDANADTDIDAEDNILSPEKKEKMHKRLEELEANSKNTKKGFPSLEVS